MRLFRIHGAARMSTKGQGATPELTSGSIDRLIPITELLAITSFSKATVYRKVREKSFPAPLKIGKSRVAWRTSSISTWMNEQKHAAS
jgi:prophage regulatory protein